MLPLSSRADPKTVVTCRVPELPRGCRGVYVSKSRPNEGE
jgi:hypothetical protein